MTISRIRAVGLLGFVALAFVACSAPTEEDDSQSGSGAISSGRTAADVTSDTGADSGPRDCAKGGDDVCRSADLMESPRTGKYEQPLCYYLAKTKVYRCTTQDVSHKDDPRRAFFGARNGKIPGSGVLCAMDENTCEQIDPRLECQSDPADSAKAGYPSGDCFAKR